MPLHRGLRWAKQLVPKKNEEDVPDKTFDCDLFEGNAGKEFECAICFEVHATNVVSLDPCGHLFGKNCISKTIKRNCPTCKTVYMECQVSPAKYVERKIGQLKMRCNHSEECKWAGTLNDFKKHLCPFEVIACDQPGCDAKIERRHMAKHLADKDAHWKKAIEHKVETLTKGLHEANATINRLKRKRVEDKYKMSEMSKVLKKLKRDVKGGKWDFTIKFLTNDDAHVSVNPTSTVKDLKRIISEQEDIPVRKQVLIFGGQELKNVDIIEDIPGIEDESKVWLVQAHVRQQD